MAERGEIAAAAVDEAFRQHNTDNKNVAAMKAPVKLPGGQAGGNYVDAASEAFAMPGYDFQQNKFLAKPESMLKNPKGKDKRGLPNYAWLNKDEPETSMLVRSGRYRKVLKDELLSDHEGVIETHEGTDDGVFWYNLMLCEATEKGKYERFKAPEDFAIRRLSTVPQQFMAQVEDVASKELGRGFKGEFGVEQ